MFLILQMLVFLDTVVVRDQCGLHKMRDTKPEILVKKKSGIFSAKLSGNRILLEKKMGSPSFFSSCVPIILSVFPSCVRNAPNLNN